VEPWNSSLIWRSKSMRRGSFWLSPIGFLGHFGRQSSETLGFPGKRRKRHAETTEPSGKSGVARLPPVFPRKSVVSSSTRGRFWAYEAVNPRFSPEKQGLDALNNYRDSCRRHGRA